MKQQSLLRIHTGFPQLVRVHFAQTLESRDPQAALAQLTDAERAVHEASIEGDRQTLVADSFIPGLMAVIYLLLLVYFKAIGGYKPVRIGSGND